MHGSNGGGYQRSAVSRPHRLQLPLALDAARWGLDVAFQLLPFALGGMGDRFNGLINDGLKQYVTLFEATGRSEEATQARALLSRLSN